MALSEPGKLQARVPTTRAVTEPTQARRRVLQGGYSPDPDRGPLSLSGVTTYTPPASPVGMVRSSRSPLTSTRTQMIGGHPSAVRFSGAAPLAGSPGYSPSHLTNATFFATHSSQDPYRDRDRDRDTWGGEDQERRGFAQGGEVPPSPQDTQPAMLEPGEYVLPKWLVDDIKAGNPPGKDSVGLSSGPFIPGMEHGGEVHDDGFLGNADDNARRARDFGTNLLSMGWVGSGKDGDFKEGYIPRAFKKGALYKAFGGGDSAPVARPDTSFQDQLNANTAKAAKDEADAKIAREQTWASMSAANASRKEAAIQRGSKLVRNIGEATREEHEVNTANAARAALATSSIQPMEASLSRASQMQLRSSLQGALIRTSAEIKAEEMSYHAEMQAIDGELAILSQKVNAETDNVARARYLEDMQEASRQREYFLDKAMDAQLRLQKAQDPGFMRSMLPGLIQGAATVIGSIYGGPAGGVAAGTAAKLGTDYFLEANMSPEARGILDIQQPTFQ